MQCLLCLLGLLSLLSYVAIEFVRFLCEQLNKRKKYLSNAISAARKNVAYI